MNVRVPGELKAYNLVGSEVKNDDLDDFVNNAHNHYIMVGRGPGGATGGAVFAQYKDVASEFVRRCVAPALVSGRPATLSLESETRPVAPLKVLTDPIKGVLKHLTERSWAGRCARLGWQQRPIRG